MVMLIFIINISILFIYSIADPIIRTQPEQIHISLGDKPHAIVVTWVTFDKTNTSCVEYSVSSRRLDTRATGSADLFVDGGDQKRTLFMHRVVLRDLRPSTRYIYHVGSTEGWSALFSFLTYPEGRDWPISLAVYGDMGNGNAQSLARLQEETQRDHFHAILHVGDFAYNMDSENAVVGDEFMKQIESIAAYVPYMTCVGNHENAYNFSNYKRRFTMPGGDGNGMFYSFNIGRAHIVAFSSEFYYYTQYGTDQIVEQYKWLIDDLQEANTEENRRARPWIISMCHRPLYCSNSDDGEHCTNKQNIIRVGLPKTGAYAIEPLLYKYGVDLHFTAHEHSYERLWPVYNLTVCNGTDNRNVYKNPDSPVNIVTGSAGCHEGVDPFNPTPFPWTAAHSDDYGYTRVNVMNDTHLYLEQVSDDQRGKVIDTMTLIKEKHGAGLYTCHKKSRK